MYERRAAMAHGAHKVLNEMSEGEEMSGQRAMSSLSAHVEGYGSY